MILYQCGNWNRFSLVPISLETYTESVMEESKPDFRGATRTDTRRLSEEEITSVETMISLLQDKELGNIWGESTTDTDGTQLVWTENMATKLYEDFHNGEREMYITTYTLPTGGEVKRLETGMNSVRAHVYYTSPEGIFHLVQYVAKKTQIRTADGELSASVMSGKTKKRDSSVSGKVSKAMNDVPRQVLAKEMAEELHISTDQYRVVSESELKSEENFSFGYPGLWTRFNYTEYNVILNDDGYNKDGYHEYGKPIEAGNRITTQVNMFRWEQITALPQFDSE